MALQYSNTSSQIQVDTRTFIDRCYGVLKLRPQQVSQEMIQIALDIINLVQLDLLNDGCPLWTIQKHLQTLSQGQQQYALPAATNDIVKAFYRTMANLTASGTLTQSINALQYAFTTATNVTTFALNWPSASFGVTFQNSPDGITWTQVSTSNLFQTGLTGQVYYDLDNSAAALYWRVIPTVVSPANTLPVTVVGAVYNTPTDVEMYRMNRDDYWNLTNKTFQGRPLQFWLDRKVAPQMDVWPAPDATAAGNLMLVWRQRMIFDPGTLQQTLEFPPRWYLPFVYMVSEELGMVTPEADPTVVGMVVSKARMMRQRAWLEERDKSPVKFQTNIGIYTK